jgi:hypothetical protein
VKKIDLFDSSPKWIHRHTICVGIKLSIKNGFENTFIHFNSFFNDFRGIVLISVKKIDLFDSSLKVIQRHTICVGIEVFTKN